MRDAVIRVLESITRGTVAGVQAHLDESHLRTRMEFVEMASWRRAARCRCGTHLNGAA